MVCAIFFYLSTQYVGLEFKSAAQLLRKPAEFVSACKGAQDDKYISPLCQVRVLNDVREIVGHDTFKESNIRVPHRPTAKVSLLRALQQILASLDC